MKTLSERIAERARMTSACTPRSNRAIILALRQDVQQALDDGWSVLAVHQTLYNEGRVTFSYQAFRRHVNRLLLGKIEAKKHHTAQLRKQAVATSEKPKKSFLFNASPKIEDLL